MATYSASCPARSVCVFLCVLACALVRVHAYVYTNYNRRHPFYQEDIEVTCELTVERLAELDSAPPLAVLPMYSQVRLTRGDVCGCVCICVCV